MLTYFALTGSARSMIAPAFKRASAIFALPQKAAIRSGLQPSCKGKNNGDITAVKEVYKIIVMYALERYSYYITICSTDVHMICTFTQ